MGEETLPQAGPPLQEGDPVRFASRDGVDSGVGLIARAFPAEDRYTVKLADSEAEIKKPDGCFLYFRRRDLQRVTATKRQAPVPEVEATKESGGATVEPEPKKQRPAEPTTPKPPPVPPRAPVVAGSSRAPHMGSLKSVLGGMFTGPTRLEGRVKWFSKDKGFGKIMPLVAKGSFVESPDELFVHRNELEGGAEGSHYAAIGPGVLVTYERAQQKDGKPCAGKVRCEGHARPREAGGSETVEDRMLRKFLMAGLQTGSHQEKGQGKVTMEDRLVHRAGVAVDDLCGAGRQAACAFFGVFDGHAGVSCSDFVATQLDRSIFECLRDQKKRDVTGELALRSAVLAGFRITEHNFLQYANKLDGGAARTWAAAGSTACTALLFGPDESGRLRLLVANLGDSRALLGRKDGQVLRLSEDHTPNAPAERKRIELQGGTVAQVGNAWRVVLSSRRGQIAAGLSVARSFGDLDFKVPVEVVSPVPEITAFDVNQEKDAFLVLATDGVFAGVSDAEAVRLVSAALRCGGEGAADAAARALVEAAHAWDATDDKTALVVWFGELPELGAGSGGPAGDASQPTGSVAAGEDIFVSDEPCGDPVELALLDDIFAGYARDLGVASDVPEQEASMTKARQQGAGTGSSAAKRKGLSAKAAKRIF